jgi:hypothetical protein
VVFGGLRKRRSAASGSGSWRRAAARWHEHDENFLPAMAAGSGASVYPVPHGRRETDLLEEVRCHQS